VDPTDQSAHLGQPNRGETSGEVQGSIRNRRRRKRPLDLESLLGFERAAVGRVARSRSPEASEREDRAVSSEGESRWAVGWTVGCCGGLHCWAL
jgi:hypothetical protein